METSPTMASCARQRSKFCHSTTRSALAGWITTLILSSDCQQSVPRRPLIHNGSSGCMFGRTTTILSRLLSRWSKTIGWTDRQRRSRWPFLSTMLSWECTLSYVPISTSLVEGTSGRRSFPRVSMQAGTHTGCMAFTTPSGCYACSTSSSPRRLRSIRSYSGKACMVSYQTTSTSGTLSIGVVCFAVWQSSSSGLPVMAIERNSTPLWRNSGP
mmetsp:Transcript_64915/g.155048  ORF Transcript_64915/g.155048 Transcript_64915/m.155048 type:complete len:213 (-) Transcript_64915:1273-1911(-)